MEVPVPVGLTFIAIVIFFVWRIYQRKIQQINEMPDIPQAIPVEGFKVPVLATYSGRRGMGRHATTSHNSLNPSLTLFEDRLELRVLLSQVIRLSDIEYVDIWDSLATRNLQIYVKGEEDLFTANLYNRKNLAKVLSYLKKRSVRLSADAGNFLAKNPLK